MTLIDFFLQRLRSFGQRDAMVFDGRTHSYADIVENVADWDRYLDEHDIRTGQVVALEAAHSPLASAGLLALVARGAIVAPLTELPEAKRAEFHDIGQVEVVLGVGAGGERSCTHSGRFADHTLYDELRARNVPGLVLFSSGTTGRSKASLLDFDRALGRYGQPTRARRTLSFLNLDHIGGINTLLHTLSQGGAVVTVGERTPDGVFAAVEAHAVEVLPTTPTFLTMALIADAIGRYDTTTLELVTYGTEPMPAQTLSALRAALPHVRIKQTYGLSELGILPTKSKSDSSLWVKLGGAGFEYKILDNVLWVRSEMAMLGYLNAAAPFDSEGFFNTRDVVEVDGDYVRILGRDSEIINVGGEKVYPSEVEGVVLEVDNVADAAVSGKRSPVTGMVVQATVRLVQPEDEQLVAERVRRHCGARLEPFKVPMLVKVHDGALHSERFKKVRALA